MKEHHSQEVHGPTTVQISMKKRKKMAKALEKRETQRKKPLHVTSQAWHCQSQMPRLTDFRAHFECFHLPAALRQLEVPPRLQYERHPFQGSHFHDNKRKGWKVHEIVEGHPSNRYGQYTPDAISESLES